MVCLSLLDLMIALTAASLFTPLERIEQPLLLIEDGAILEISSRASRPLPKCRVRDFGSAILAPAFLDIHVHGGAGHDVMQSDPAGLAAMERLLAQHGVSGYLPTTVTAPVDTTLAALDRLASAIEQPDNDGDRAQPLGIHLEGPFISHVRRGVHPAENLLPPSLEMFDRFWQAARGNLRIMTIAPELEGAAEVIAEARRRKVCVSLGHSDADQAATRAAIDAGARHATHTFNAMRPLGHRDPGIVAEVLTSSALTADIIADGIHLAPVIVELFLRAKGAEAAVLISDAIAATGMPDGRYRLGPFEVDVREGRCLAEGKLAGSVLTLDRAVRNVMEFAGWELQTAVRLATLNPVRVAGLAGRGTVARGARADLVVLTPEGQVRQTIIGGVV